MQKTYAVEKNEILQQIEAKWEPVFNRPKEASFDEFLARFRNYVTIQQCTIGPWPCVDGEHGKAIKWDEVLP